MFICCFEDHNEVRDENALAFMSHTKKYLDTENLIFSN